MWAEYLHFSLILFSPPHSFTSIHLSHASKSSHSPNCLLPPQSSSTILLFSRRLPCFTYTSISCSLVHHLYNILTHPLQVTNQCWGGMGGGISSAVSPQEILKSPVKYSLTFTYKFPVYYNERPLTPFKNLGLFGNCTSFSLSLNLKKVNECIHAYV